MPVYTELAWLVAVAPVAGIGWYVAGTPAPVVVAALITAACSLGALLWVARAARVPLRPPVAIFALVWGAGVAAPAAAIANELLQAHVHAGGWTLAVVTAPPLEEAAKAAVLLVLIALWRTELRELRAGIVLGGLAGLGFGLAENLGYFLIARFQEGPAGLVRAVAVRGFFESPVHPVFAATAGAGLGAARAAPRRRTLRTLAGFAAAVTQHALWNGAASPAVSAILCNDVAPSGACHGDPGAWRLLVAVPAIVVAALAPGVLGLAVLARRSPAPAG